MKLRNLCPLFLLSSLLILGCQDPFTTSKVTAGGYDLSRVPFARDQDLSSTNTSSSIVPWKVARALSVHALKKTVEPSTGLSETHLSSKPVIIYDSHSIPKYYEFIVLNSAGKGVGTLSTYATTDHADILASFQDTVRDYDALNSGSGAKFYSNNYPSELLVGIPGSNTEVINPLTGERTTLVEEQTFEESLERLKGYSAEQLTSLGITDLNATLSEKQAEHATTLAAAKSYWDEVRLHANVIGDVDDSTIEADGAESHARFVLRSTAQIVVSRVRYGKPDDRTQAIWRGWCGPSALAEIYRILYDSYNGTKLKLTPYEFRDSSQESIGYESWVRNKSGNPDGGLYRDLCAETHVFSKPYNATMPWYLDPALRSVTGNQYRLVPKLMYEELRDQLRRTNLPGLILVALPNGWHYLTVIGYTENASSTPFLWWTITTYSPLFLVYDNGATSSSHGLRPYWRTAAEFAIHGYWNVARN